MMLRTHPLVSGFFMLLVLPIVANAEDTVGCQKRTVVVNVLDRMGNQVTGLGQDVFRAKVQGKDLRVRISPTNGPRRVVIVVDLSGSMVRSSPFARQLAGNLAISAQPGKLQLALVLFSDRIIDSVDFSRPPEEIVRKLDSLPEANGRTALFDALKFASDLFAQPLPGDSVYLLSDGADSSSRANSGDVKREFIEKGIRFFSFRLQDHFFPTEEERDSAQLLPELAKLTGGAILDIDVGSSRASREHLVSVLQQLYHQMAEFYMLQLELPETPIRKQQHWELEVLDAQGKKRKDVRVIYPHELPACGTSAN